MKSAILASVLALGFAASANAALVPIMNATNPLVLTGVTTPVTGYTGSTTPSYWSVIVNQPGTTVLFDLGGAPGPVTFSFFTDNDGDAFNFTGDIGLSAVTTGIVTSSSPVSVAVAAGTYVLKLTSSNTRDSVDVSSVPVPAAAWLFGSALFGAGALRRKQQA